jgi:hypothetical protein
VRLQLAFSCLLLLSLTGAGAAQGSAASSCERARSEDVITSISSRGELSIGSGRVIKLLDIWLPLDDDQFREPLAFLRSLAGRRVAVAALGGVDRWGRDAGDVALLDEPSPIDVAELLVGEGFALVDAGGRNMLCRPELLVMERRARARRIGLWARDDYQPVAASDLTRLKKRIGRFALVEGRVRSVGERRERTYLNFGRDWKEDLTITIPKRIWAIMRERGLSAASLRGRRVRARGVVEEWQGVAVEITAADMLEVIGRNLTRP